MYDHLILMMQKTTALVLVQMVNIWIYIYAGVETLYLHSIP